VGGQSKRPGSKTIAKRSATTGGGLQRPESLKEPDWPGLLLIKKKVGQGGTIWAHIRLGREMGGIAKNSSRRSRGRCEQWGGNRMPKEREGNKPTLPCYFVLN